MSVKERVQGGETIRHEVRGEILYGVLHAASMTWIDSSKTSKTWDRGRPKLGIKDVQDLGLNVWDGRQAVAAVPPICHVGDV